MTMRRWSPTRSCAAACSLALAIAVPTATVTIPTTASASAATPLLLKPRRRRGKKPKDGVTPAQAAEKRVPIQQTGQSLIDAGEPAQAGLEFDRGAAAQGDPVLYLDAGDAYLAAARADADVEMAATAIERARIAQDILYFHLDSAADPDFRLVENAEVPALINRADELIEEAEAAIEEINAAADPTGPTDDEPKKKGDGKIMVMSGIGLASVGGALVVMGVAGLAIGAVNQNRADRDTVYGSEYDEVERRGKRGNVIAGVGFALGAACIGGGLALYFLGKKRRKQAADDDKVVMVSPTLGGLAVTGRF
jgi:hypothetical protein